MSALDDETLLDRAAVLRLTGLRPGTFGSLEHRAQGPAFIKLGPRLKRYRARDVREWLESRRVVPAGAGAR